MSSNKTDLNNSYGFVLIRFFKKVADEFNKSLKQYSININHYRVLITIYNNENLNQKMLGEILNIDRTTMVHLIDHLEDINYLQRETNHEDRRSFKLVLTKKGESIIEPICTIRDEVQDNCLKECTVNEKKIFREICKKIGEDSNY